MASFKQVVFDGITLEDHAHLLLFSRAGGVTGGSFPQGVYAWSITDTACVALLTSDPEDTAKPTTIAAYESRLVLMGVVAALQALSTLPPNVLQGKKEGQQRKLSLILNPGHPLLHPLGCSPMERKLGGYRKGSSNAPYADAELLKQIDALSAELGVQVIARTYLGYSELECYRLVQDRARELWTQAQQLAEEKFG